MDVIPRSITTEDILHLTKCQKTYLWTYICPGKVSDQPVHLYSLIRIFTGYILDSHAVNED